MVVAGAGYLGSRILKALPEQFTVALTRRADPSLAAGRILTVDLDHGDEQPVSPEPPYALIYTVPPPGEGTDDPRLAELLSRLEPPPTRLVLISTTGVYGDRGGAAVSETDPVNPDSPRSRRRVAAEARAKQYCETSGCSLVILRVPGIYGPGRLGIDRLAQGGELLRKEDAGPGNRIHVDDLVACCVAALSDDTASGIYNVGDGDHRSTTAFSLAVVELAGLPMPEMLSLEEAQQAWSPMRLSFVTESRRVETRKMRDALGVTLRYPNPVDGIRASLDAESQPT